MLDTLINKTEQFVEKEPIHVPIDGWFRSCALLSETDALVFTSKKVILVSLVNKVQKQLTYPPGIKGTTRSLNIMKDVPYMIVSAYVTE